MKVLITGSSGQLGKTLNLLKPKNIEILNTTKETFDLNNDVNISKYILKNDPDWIINCGAYTHVDNAEKDKNIVFQVNSNSVKTISNTLLKMKGKLLQISTDFVFDGNKNNPYKPYEKTSPINTYGYSKMLAEDYIKEIFIEPNKAVILRTSWLMSHFGNNFALKMLNLHKKNKKLNVVTDQIGSPTSTFTLAKICWEIILSPFKWKDRAKENSLILHACDSGIASWYDVAESLGEIGEELGLIDQKAEVKPIKSEEYFTLAKRPIFSALESNYTFDILNLKSKHWRNSMIEFLKLVDPQKL